MLHGAPYTAETCFALRLRSIPTARRSSQGCDSPLRLEIEETREKRLKKSWRHYLHVVDTFDQMSYDSPKDQLPAPLLRPADGVAKRETNKISNISTG